MSDTLVAVDQTTIDQLTKLAKSMGVSSDYLPVWINYVLNHSANDFAEYVRTFWASGQAISRVTGETFNTIMPFVPSRKRRKNKTDEIYYSVRPGVGVLGNLNFHGRWAKPAYEQFGHEFMRPAFQAFTAGNKVEGAVQENVDRGIQWALNGGHK